MLRAEIKNISVLSSGQEKILLNDLNFSLQSNSINVVLGKNGTGKSTLIKALTRLLDERFYRINGKVLINNTDLYSLTRQELLNIRREKIRCVFQDAINSFDPLKTIGYYFRGYEFNPDTDQLLSGFLLPDRKDLFRLYPYEISGGMAQRLLLVLALIVKPEILILDEPTSGIDTPVANLILMKLKEFAAKNDNLVLLVSQDLQFAKSVGDRIAFLADGTLSSFVSVDEFFNSRELSDLNNFISAFNQLV